MRVLSIDPGETTGWAYQDERDDYPGGLLDFGQIKGIKEFAVWLENWNLEKKPIDFVVIEDYVVWAGNRGAKANVGSRLETVRVLGAVESWCFRNDKKFKKYPSAGDFLKLQALQCGLDPTRGAHKNTHWAYAANHGRYYLQEIKLAKTALQRSMLK